MEEVPNDEHDNGEDEQGRPARQEQEEGEGGVNREDEDDDEDDDDENEDEEEDEDDENDPMTAWIPVLTQALNRSAPLAEIRTVLLQLVPEVIRNSASMGASILSEVLCHSRQGRGAGRGGGGRQRGGGGGGYPTLPMVKFLVEEVGWGPEILSELLDDGKRALHVAIVKRSPPNVVKYLVKMAPQVVQERTVDHFQFLPIHLAVDVIGGVVGVDDDEEENFHMAPWETVQCLLEAWPESIQQTTEMGLTPLHHAVRHLRRNRPNDRRVVRNLINRWPEALARKTQYRYEHLPFHVAVIESAPVQDLRYLLNMYPEAIRTREGASNDWYLPLHLAFVQPNGATRITGISSLPTIRFLVEAFPSSLVEWTPEGSIPLHLALKSESNDFGDDAPKLDVVRFLVEECPMSIRVANKHGWVALHVAASNPCTSPEMIRFLVKKHPEAVTVQAKESRYTPLHVAIQSDLSVAGIDALTRAGPGALHVRTFMGELPIHFLLWGGGGGHDRQRWRLDRTHGTLLDALKCLAAHGGPSYLCAKTSLEGNTPLHSALRVRASESLPGEEEGELHDDAVVEYLLEQCPELVRERTTDRGWLALHCAAERGRSPRALRSLLNAWPDSIHQVTRDDKQMLPIHLAAAIYLASVPSLEVLLDAWPESAFEMSGEGWLPIHYAAGERGTVGTTQCLLDRHPETVRSRTRDGFLPLHLAVLRRNRKCVAANEIIRCLVTRDPNALLAKAGVEGSLPLHLALRSNVPDEDIVNYLVEQCPESVRHRDNGGSLPLHVVLAQARPECGRDPFNLPSIVDNLVNLHPESLQVADSRGRLPLHLASESNHASLDVVYLLLRRRPDTIRGSGRGIDDIDVLGARGAGRRRPAPAMLCRGSDSAAKRPRSGAAP